MSEFKNLKAMIERMNDRLITAFNDVPTHLFVSPEVHTLLCLGEGDTLKISEWRGQEVIIVPSLDEGLDAVEPTLLMSPPAGIFTGHVANIREKIMWVRGVWLRQNLSPTKIFVGPIVHTQLCQLCKVETLVGNGFCGLRVHLVPSITDDLFYLR